MSTGMLDPHQPAPKSDIPKGEAVPTDEEKELCKQIDQLFKKYAKHRRKYDKDWIDNYKMYRGQQWLKKRPSYKSREVINLIYQTIQSQTSVMMDVRPTLGFTPREPGDLELAEIISMLWLADWDRHNWSDELLAQVYDAHFYSVGISSVAYDPELRHIVYQSEDILDFYPDPDASDVNKKAEGFIKAKPEDVAKLKKRYAGHKYAQFIKPDLESMDYEKRSMETLHRAKNTDLDLPVESTTSAYSVEDEDKNKALVITAYLKPSDVEVVEREDLESPEEKIYITKKKYPRGRKVVKINGYIFEDQPLEDDHLEFPYQRLVNSILPREFYGVSEVDNTKGPQMVFNRLVNFAIDVLTLMGNPIWLNPLEANVNSRKLNNSPGLVVEFAGQNPPQRVEGVGLQPAVFQLIDRMEKWFNDEAGTQDVTRGVNPTGVTANAAIENLLEQAQKRIKQKMRNMDSCLKCVGKHWLSNVFQYYTAPEIFRLTNKEGTNQYFKFHVEDRPTGEVDELGQAKSKKVAIVRNYTGPVPDNEQKEFEIRADFDIVINTISGLPFSEAEKETKLLNYFNAGIIDQQEVLEKSDYPNWQAIIQRMQQQAAAQAEAAPPQGA